MKSDLKDDNMSILRTHLFDLHFFDAFPRLLLLLQIPAWRAISSWLRASATPIATNCTDLHLIALASAYLHPVAPNTIFSAEPQQLQLVCHPLSKTLSKTLSLIPRLETLPLAIAIQPNRTKSNQIQPIKA